jgi:1-deoxy-D-xylulose-5-phosphate reductoisomerase
MATPTIKRIAILGSTGSIGLQTLDIVRRLPDRLRVTAVAAGSNGRALAEQMREFAVTAAALVDKRQAFELDALLAHEADVFFGAASLETIAVRPDVDIVVVAVAGAIGVRATISALAAGKTVALATKEVLVAAGSVVTEAARLGGGTLIPIDSEHSGVFQCLAGQPVNSVKKIWLTASGGPFRSWSAGQIEAATVEQALNHPTWSMGRKVTIDSATMMNKGLEMIEAKWLFNISIDRIGIIVHPQSTVHALVQYHDGSVLAQLGTADMRLPIEYALLYPERIDAQLPQLDIMNLRSLEFEPPDEERFPCLRLARAASVRGGTAPAVMNAANEEAVELFLKRQIPFLGIPRIVEEALNQQSIVDSPSLDQILLADERARNFVSEAVTA